ncbi:MAG: heme-binding protein [Chloroflexi bacterium]|nr:heme-binding protein [Chloroflexota bacterium]
MLTNPTVSLEDAQVAASAALAAAKPGDAPIAVCVTNENGDTVYLVRQDGTSAVDVRNAERKAYTAAFIGRDTSVYRAQLAHDGRTVADWADERVTTLSGGWTLRRESQVIGGIGVAGSGGEDRDERLALAGAEAAARLAVDAWRAQRAARL